MSETLISFFLSVGIIIAFIAWGFLCIAWPERPGRGEASRDLPGTSDAEPPPLRDGPV